MAQIDPAAKPVPPAPPGVQVKGATGGWTAYTGKTTPAIAGLPYGQQIMAQLAVNTFANDEGDGDHADRAVKVADAQDLELRWA